MKTMNELVDGNVEMAYWLHTSRPTPDRDGRVGVLLIPCGGIVKRPFEGRENGTYPSQNRTVRRLFKYDFYYRDCVLSTTPVCPSYRGVSAAGWWAVWRWCQQCMVITWSDMIA